MSEIYFFEDRIFWIVLFVLEAFWIAGFISAYRDGLATSKQALNSGRPECIHWFGHAGFWDLLIILNPILAYGTSKVWPFWQARPGGIVLCLLAGGMAGYMLQRDWSRAAGNSDAWSKDGNPNKTGWIHVANMSPEIGIMLMLLFSGLIFREIPVQMFFGLLCIVLSHLSLGNHWPIRMQARRPKWVPRELLELGEEKTALYVLLWSTLFFVGWIFLIL